MISVALSDPAEPEARALLQASHDLMRALFDPEDNHFLSIEALQGPDVRFFTGSLGGKTVATGAMAVKDGYGEVKSMFTSDEARGKGVAYAVLAKIEEDAIELGLPLLRLETGDTLLAARAMYTKAGFSECGRFGDYPMDGARSVFMEKRIG